MSVLARLVYEDPSTTIVIVSFLAAFFARADANCVSQSGVNVVAAVDDVVVIVAFALVIVVAINFGGSE